MIDVKQQLIAALAYIRDDSNSELSHTAQVMIRGVLAFADDEVIRVINVETKPVWKSIDDDGQPKKAGTYEVRYDFESENEEYFDKLYYNGTEWLHSEDNATTAFGNYETDGEFYREVE